MVKCIIIFIFQLFIFSAHTQKSLSISEIKDYSEEAKRKVNSFLSYVNSVSNGSSQSDTYIKLAVDLFEPEARIEVANVVGSKISKKRYAPKMYLIALSKYKNRFVRNVTHFESVKISGLRPVTDPKTKEVYYVGTASFVMSFCADKTEETEGWEYCDYTEKDIEIVLKQRNSIAGKYWILLLGDISVKEILGRQ